ncbi:permease prefix domain 1-containing protein [Streptomyces sp. AJS327]|uniref:permease prefix domain 1-containing protein n=1 Tax=Streptomyces sp. AJS327 TaxID=2545265 RepID=UPI0015DF5055|nr:permease prefix domain 1-containing protein [Streptomyces sp. AJS327]
MSAGDGPAPVPTRVRARERVPAAGGRAETGGSEAVEEHLAALAAVLRGPSRARARMLEELRHGLTDTVAAYTDQGLPPPAATRRALHDFGGVEDLAPDCQRELTIAQVRHTARATALTLPPLVACWHLALAPSPGGGWPLSPWVFPLVVLSLVAVGAAALAAGGLLATGVLARRVRTPRRLPLAVAWTGSTASVAMPLGGLALLVSAPGAANWPLVLLAAALTAAAHAVLATSARRCRSCVRPPEFGRA